MISFWRQIEESLWHVFLKLVLHCYNENESFGRFLQQHIKEELTQFQIDMYIKFQIFQ